MLKIMDVTQAQETILRRSQTFEPANPALLQDAMVRIFGQPLTPVQAVERILSDVQSRGDDALTFWTERIDNVDLATFSVPRQTIETALDRIPAEFFSMVRGTIIEGIPLPKFSLSAGSLEMFVTRQPASGSNGRSADAFPARIASSRL